jgi:N utilization substance protein A
MAMIKLDTEKIRAMATFEKVTKVPVKDCIILEDCAYFLVQEGKMGLAIGKNGSGIRDVKGILGRHVKVFEYSDRPEQMIKNFIPEANSIEVNGGVASAAVPLEARSSVIGRNGNNIKTIRGFLERNFDIKNFRLR